MKKIIATFLTLVLVFMCCSCKSNPDNIYASDQNVASFPKIESHEADDTSSLDSILSSSDEVDSSNVSSKENTTSKPSVLPVVSTSETTTLTETTTEQESDSKSKEPENTPCAHSYENATCTTAKSCTLCGKKEGDALGHKYTSANCTTPATCTVCGTKSGDALGHKYTKATCTAPAACTVCGTKSGDALGHKYTKATCTTPATCSTCGSKSGKAPGHNFKTTATASNKCTVCGTIKCESNQHKYILGECTVCNDYDSSYCPKLYLTGDMYGMYMKKDVRNITFEYRSKDQILSGGAKIKTQGSSSLQYTKKNYTINFYENDSYSKSLGVNVGWGAQKEYCLKANWIDKTHSRNIVTAKLAGQVQKKYNLFNSAPNNGAIDGFPIEVYINNEFHGLYTMNIPKDAWMFSMDEKNPNHIVICGENWLDPVMFKEIPTDFSTWAVEVGSESFETLEKVQRLVKFIRDSSDAEFKKNINQYLDLDSTLNYYVMMRLCYLPDNTGKNMLLATYDGKIWYPSLYDLDTSWGADYEGRKIYDYENELITARGSLLWQRMEKLYKDEIIQRHFELRKDILNANNIMSLFTDFRNSIPNEVLDRETKKWNTEHITIPGFNLSQIQHYVDYGIPKLDESYKTW